MSEGSALLAVGAGTLVAIGLLAGQRTVPPAPPVPAVLRRMGRREMTLATAAFPAAGWQGVVLLQSAAAALVGGAAWVVTALPVVALAAALAAGIGARILLGTRARGAARKRQDAVLEAIRMLRGLLESGGVGVQQGLAVLADRGPAPLRPEFAAIVAATAAGRPRAAWVAARARVADPLFDMLCAAILVQRPAGGALAPLFADLEQSVSGIHEVVREAEALQVQARSAAALIVVLPLAFLLVLSALRSPYLDAYRTPTGSAFLAVCLAVIGLSYGWVLRSLRLPAEPRLVLADG